MNTWFTSDYHMFHKNILKYDNRPFSTIEEMNEKIILNHNSVVAQDDEVWFLGDFIFGSTNQFLKIYERLHGKFHIIFGNHDKIARENKHVFRSYQDFKEISIQGQHITLCHYGMRVWNGSHRAAWQLYGHSHNSLPPIGKQMDVGIMNNNYYPFSFNEVKKILDAKQGEVVDHHQ